MVHVVGGQFDESRNTSRVFPVLPGSASHAAEALAGWARSNPEHARWITEGYPTLTEAEHAARFGGPWRKGAPLPPSV